MITCTATVLYRPMVVAKSKFIEALVGPRLAVYATDPDRRLNVCVGLIALTCNAYVQCFLVCPT